MYPRSPGTPSAGSWVIASIGLYGDPRTGTQYIGNWASRVTSAHSCVFEIRSAVAASLPFTSLRVQGPK